MRSSSSSLRLLTAAALGAVVGERLATARSARRTQELLAEAEEREAERTRLAEQLITAEQDERRRLADFLHDTSVQSLSGIALMLDAAVHSVETGKHDDAVRVLQAALERHRTTIRSLRDLSFNLEPVVLRDHGFAAAVHALVSQVGIDHGVRIDLAVDAADTLTEKAQAALYQIIREALHGAVRRGPPTEMAVRVEPQADGGVEAVVSDNARGERRRATFDALAERARSLSGRLTVDGGDGGTTVRVLLPPYTARV